MKTLWAVTLFCGAIAAAPAFGAEDPLPCAKDPQNEGMQARMNTIRDEMDRIEWTTDRAEKRHLMELHIKHMREGLREMRVRKMHPDCRLEMMGSMMESMARHELVMHEDHSR